MTQTHTLEIRNNAIVKKIEGRTFKFGKARDTGGNDKLTNNVKLTDLGYDRAMVYDWIDTAVGNIRSAFAKYAIGAVTTSYETGHDNDNDYKITSIPFVLSSKWDSNNGLGFDKDCVEYVVNKAVSEFLSLSLPREADLYAQKAMQALKDAERKLYYKTA